MAYIVQSVLLINTFNTTLNINDKRNGHRLGMANAEHRVFKRARETSQ